MGPHAREDQKRGGEKSSFSPLPVKVQLSTLLGSRSQRQLGFYSIMWFNGYKLSSFAIVVGF